MSDRVGGITLGVARTKPSEYIASLAIQPYRGDP